MEITLSNLPPTITYTLLGIFALLVGSFLNVVIYRLPLILKANWLQEHLGQSSPPLSLSLPRSFCPACKKTIPIWHNIPVISFLINRGQCFACSQSIPKRYLWVELLTLISSLYVAYHFGFTPILPFVLIFTWFLLSITFIDLEHQLIPDELSITLLWIGLLANLYGLFTPLNDAVLGAIIGYTCLWGFINLYQFITKKTAMGHGDFKLFSAFGAWFGWTQLPLLLCIASFLGAVVGLSYLKITQQSKNTPIPFGPFLCISGFIILIFGRALLNYILYG